MLESLCIPVLDSCPSSKGSVLTDDAFYHVSSAGFVATELTRGPWDDQFQHAGPPAALLGRAIENAEGNGAFRVARITFEMRRPVPIAELTIHLEREPGKRVDRVAAVLCHGDLEVMRSLAVRVMNRDLPVPAKPNGGESMGAPGQLAPPGAFFRADVGYHTAMDVSFVTGSWDQPGPARAWMRPRVALVAGEPFSGLGRVLVAADSGNGISAALDIGAWRFLNTDLNVNLVREPESSWVGLDACTTIGSSGRGVATTVLHDLRGPIGSSSQTLLVEPRGWPSRSYAGGCPPNPGGRRRLSTGYSD